MKKTMLVAAMMMTGLFSGCGPADSDFEFTISPDIAPVIKAKAISCLAAKNAASTGTSPSQDLSESYARFQNVSFTYTETTKALNIYSIDIRIEGLSSGTIKETITGDELFALNTIWYTAGEAVIGGPSRPMYKKPTTTYTPATTVTSDCPLILDSLPSGTAYQATITLTAYGYTEDSDGNQEPAQSQTFISVNYRGD